MKNETKQAHTPTPWRNKRSLNNIDEILLDKGGIIIGQLTKGTHYQNEANAARIVACVNACEGISTEDLTQGVLLNGLINSLKNQRIELVEALKECLRLVEVETLKEQDEIVSKAKQALKKAGA